MKHFYEWQKAVLEMRSRRISVQSGLTSLPRSHCGKGRNFDGCTKKVMFVSSSHEKHPSNKSQNRSNILLLHDEAGNCEVVGQGAGMLSFKSHRKLTPADWSNTTSDGKLGRRHPDSTPTKMIIIS